MSGTDPRTKSVIDLRNMSGTDPRTKSGTDPRTKSGTDPRTKSGIDPREVLYQLNPSTKKLVFWDLIPEQPFLTSGIDPTVLQSTLRD